MCTLGEKKFVMLPFCRLLLRPLCVVGVLLLLLVELVFVAEQVDDVAELSCVAVASACVAAPGKMLLDLAKKEEIPPWTASIKLVTPSAMRVHGYSSVSLYM